MKNILAALLLLTLTACSPALPAPTPTQAPAPRATATFTPLPTHTPTVLPSEVPMPQSGFKVIAYLTAGIVPEAIPYKRLSAINYAFLLPNADGTFAPFPNAWKLEQIGKLAHAANVNVLISVGGWGLDQQFAALAGDPALRQAFIKNLVGFVNQYSLDGVDIDWEYPSAGQQAQDFLALMTGLRAALPDKLLTAAVVSYGENAEGILDSAFPLCDYLNVMTYDGPDHGTMEQFQQGLDYWRGRGLPPEKIVMGMPFYARPSETTYRKLVAENPKAAYTDEVQNLGATDHYNGIPTVQAKTRLALQNAGGVMFWTLDADAPGDLSLLKAIDETVHASK